MKRHASMVMGVCTRMVPDSQGAADAFQAVFLVLVRKASVVRVEDSLGRWLYGVSVRVARRARRRAVVARTREKGLEGFDRAGGALPAEECERGELRSLIDEEIARLPSRFRAVVESCYLEGLTQEQAGAPVTLPDPDGGEPLAAGEGTPTVEARAARGGASGRSRGLVFGRDGPGVRGTPPGCGDDRRGHPKCQEQGRRERSSGGRIVARP